MINEYFSRRRFRPFGLLCRIRVRFDPQPLSISLLDSKWKQRWNIRIQSKPIASGRFFKVEFNKYLFPLVMQKIPHFIINQFKKRTIVKKKKKKKKSIEHLSVD